jgi:hypothetical protein
VSHVRFGLSGSVLGAVQYAALLLGDCVKWTTFKSWFDGAFTDESVHVGRNGQIYHRLDDGR